MNMKLIPKNKFSTIKTVYIHKNQVLHKLPIIQILEISNKVKYIIIIINKI